MDESMETDGKTIEEGIEQLQQLSKLIQNPNTGIDQSMKALRMATALRERLELDLRKYELALDEISNKIEKPTDNVETEKD